MAPRIRYRRSAGAFIAALGLGTALPAAAADRSALPVRIADPAITSVCELSVDPATRVGYPAVGLTQVFPGIVSVRFVIYDAQKHVLGRHDVLVAPLDLDGHPPQLTPFYVDRGYAAARCDVSAHDERV